MDYRIGKVAVLFLLLLQFTQGAEWIVPDQHPTIQAALVVAVSGDVVLVRPGTYRENLNFLGKNVVLRGMEGADATILDARRGVGILIGPGGTVEGFTVENAYGSFGAAVRVSGSGTVIRDNVFAGNEQEVGGFGAAIGGNGASPVIERNLFRDNSADDQHLSGVVCFVNTSSPLIVNNVFVSNPTRAINLTLPQESRPVVVNNTLVENSVGIRVDARVPTDQQILRNNILFN
ncbi:MAG TPA: right-handed parallel beta-helix repeat-containing protein, partial [Methylomirabilota bacterium]|nr:right-handed parallel beta-helix repeat-containing protein [Methylomirabilota bacterium]